LVSFHFSLSICADKTPSWVEQAGKGDKDAHWVEQAGKGDKDAHWVEQAGNGDKDAIVGRTSSEG